MASQLLLLLMVSLSPFAGVHSSDPLDSAPDHLGLKGRPTASANYGWNLILDDLSRSWQVTKLYQAAHHTIAQPIHRVSNKMSKNIWPKRSSKCVFGTPDPNYHCGPNLVASLVLKEYKDYANKLWLPYLSKIKYKSDY